MKLEDVKKEAKGMPRIEAIDLNFNLNQNDKWRLKDDKRILIYSQSIEAKISVLKNFCEGLDSLHETVGNCLKSFEDYSLPFSREDEHNWLFFINDDLLDSVFEHEWKQCEDEKFFRYLESREIAQKKHNIKAQIQFEFTPIKKALDELFKYKGQQAENMFASACFNYTGFSKKLDRFGVIEGSEFILMELHSHYIDDEEEIKYYHTLAKLVGNLNDHLAKAKAPLSTFIGLDSYKGNITFLAISKYLNPSQAGMHIMTREEVIKQERQDKQSSKELIE